MRGMHSRDQKPRRTEQDHGREWAVSVLGGLGQTVLCGSHRVLKLMGALGVDGDRSALGMGDGWVSVCRAWSWGDLVNRTDASPGLAKL